MGSEKREWYARREVHERFHAPTVEHEQEPIRGDSVWRCHAKSCTQVHGSNGDAIDSSFAHATTWRVHASAFDHTNSETHAMRERRTTATAALPLTYVSTQTFTRPLEMMFVCVYLFACRAPFHFDRSTGKWPNWWDGDGSIWIEDAVVNVDTKSMCCFFLSLSLR